MRPNQWKNTRVSIEPRITTMRRSILGELISHDLKWRRHGIGCLQAYLSEGGLIETRIHIWDPSAIRPGILDHGDVHDHRFTLESTVLTGEIEHTEADVISDENGEYRLYHVTHARADIGARYELVPGPLTELAGPVRLETRSGIIASGECYTFERGAFHRSTTHGLTVTLVCKLNQIEKKAIIVSKPPPVHAFEKDDDFDPGPLVERAIAALREYV
jgi:hypothetical protein